MLAGSVVTAARANLGATLHTFILDVFQPQLPTLPGTLEVAPPRAPGTSEVTCGPAAMCECIRQCLGHGGDTCCVAKALRPLHCSRALAQPIAFQSHNQVIRGICFTIFSEFVFCRWLRPLGFTESEFYVHFLPSPRAVQHRHVRHGPAKHMT